MKRLLFYLGIVFIFLLISTKSEAITVVHQRITYSFWTDYFLCGNPPCQQNGNQCLVVVSIPLNVTSIINPAGGGLSGRIITCTFSDETEQHTPNVGYGDQYAWFVSKSFRTFRAGESLRISECPEDESLIGLTIDLEGKSTDGNGNFYYYIPY